jgi:hypothetical protein
MTNQSKNRDEKKPGKKRRKFETNRAGGHPKGVRGTSPLRLRDPGGPYTARKQDRFYSKTAKMESRHALGPMARRIAFTVPQRHKTQYFITLVAPHRHKPQYFITLVANYRVPDLPTFENYMFI